MATPRTVIQKAAKAGTPVAIATGIVIHGARGTLTAKIKGASVILTDDQGATYATVALASITSATEFVPKAAA